MQEFLNITNFNREAIMYLNSMAECYDHNIKFYNTEVMKNNDNKRDAICARFANESVAQTLYVDTLYDQFLSSNKELWDFMDIVYSNIYNSHERINDVNINITPEHAKENLILKVINKRTNPEIAKLPHINIAGDYIGVAYCVIDSSEDIRAVSLVNESMQHDFLKLTDDELLICAGRNSLNINSFTCESLESLFKLIITSTDMPEDTKDELMNGTPLMYIVTSENKMDGAVAIASRDVLDNLIPNTIHETYPDEKEYFIIPSSIHEGATRFAA